MPYDPNARIVIYYVQGPNERQPGKKVAQATFKNATDALIFWKALPEIRKRCLVMENVLGESVLEIAHTGWNESYGYHGHANALTALKANPPRTRDREDAERRGWEFERIGVEK